MDGEGDGMESRLSSQIFFTLQIYFFRLKEVLLVTLLPLGALVTLVILVTTKDQMIQAGSCCPTEPKLEPNHHGVLQVPRQEREAETEMEFVDDPLTNPDLVTQVRINTMGINRLSRRKRGMASNPLFIIPDFFFFAFSQ